MLKNKNSFYNPRFKLTDFDDVLDFEQREFSKILKKHYRRKPFLIHSKKKNEHQVKQSKSVS